MEKYIRLQDAENILKRGEAEIREGKVSMLQQKADKSWKFRVSDSGSVSDYTLDEIGSGIFLNYD